MKETVLIVEDQFVEANDLRLILQKAGYRVTGIARAVSKALECIQEEKPDIVLLDIFLKGPLTGIDLAKQLNELNIPFVYLSANSNQEVLSAAKETQPDGFLVKPFREKDVLVTLEIARYRHAHTRDSSSGRESQLQKQLLPIFNEAISWEQKLLKAGKGIQPFIPFEYLSAGIYNKLETSYNDVGFLRIGFDEYQVIGVNELMVITNLKRHELVALQSQTHQDTTATRYEATAFKQLCVQPCIQLLIADTFEMNSYLVFPILLPNGQLFHFSFYSRRLDAYQAQHLSLVSRLQPFLATAVGRVLSKENRFDLKLNNNSSLDSQKKGSIPLFDGIIGSSHQLLNVFDHIMMVAPSDTSVLILGESGTGKERIANCIHTYSPRKLKPLIRVNCATLPATLIESELFGHEKGAFTGATDRRIGKFELATGGTIFLDEIGEMPLDMQVKLLRVLQEKEIDRIGGRSSIKIDVRIVAATNRNLEKEVAQGRFRLDLYYRLNVFPITLPPLRERKEDIMDLTTHFIQHYNRKTGKKITGLSSKVLDTLMAYNWPGNIRELEHFIERSILLTKGTIIEDIGFLNINPTELNMPDKGHIKTIDENEREHIIEVLKKCNGRIWGEGGAAQLLNVPPTTLNSKMKKLGIKKVYQGNS
ncbi:response regulator [Rhodocytophaga rosea]|uniref:Response regulator n=1 Tax=Rhodocytophaga rosea TaxID=2704465 RepID=A0A6C0GFW8_9BACT|nr:sigma 54-interacting response regulator [Rhodocytophaga rosea]QHT66951.1 response regulator [Rhodocytophaga rosea]